MQQIINLSSYLYSRGSEVCTKLLLLDTDPEGKQTIHALVASFFFPFSWVFKVIGLLSGAAMVAAFCGIFSFRDNCWVEYKNQN